MRKARGLVSGHSMRKARGLISGHSMRKARRLSGSQQREVLRKARMFGDRESAGVSAPALAKPFTSQQQLRSSPSLSHV